MERETSTVDDIAFDRLTRLFSSSQPRRGTLRAALGLVLGGTVIGRSPDALGADDDELAGEAVAGGRGSLGDLGGGFGGKRRKSNRNQGKGGGGDGKHKRKRRDKCTKAGKLRKHGKPCCKGLDRDSAGRCIRRQPNLPAGGCDPNACPSDPATKKRGFCCPGGYCSCGGVCCGGPECWTHTVYITNGEDILDVSSEYCSPEEAGCVLCPSSGESCCSACVNGECASSGPIRGGSIRRR
jgi:hypothetical protein